MSFLVFLQPAWKQSLSLLPPSSSPRRQQGSKRTPPPMGRTAPAATRKRRDRLAQPPWFLAHTRTQCLTSQKVIVLMNFRGSPPPKVPRSPSAQKTLFPNRVNSVSASLTLNNGPHQGRDGAKGGARERRDNEINYGKGKLGKKINAEEKDEVDRRDLHKQNEGGGREGGRSGKRAAGGSVPASKPSGCGSTFTSPWRHIYGGVGGGDAVSRKSKSQWHCMAEQAPCCLFYRLDGRIQNKTK